MTIRLNTEAIRIVALFEQITGVAVKDCITDNDSVYFLVEPKKLGLAIGKGGVTIKTLKKMLGREIKVFEYADTPQGLIKNLIPQAREIKINNDQAEIQVNFKDRAAVIGRGGKNINMVKEFLYRMFKIKDIRLR
ncbi:MAG: NusA-like transcription termination signal-binding factor [Candidatus Aenigmatarchaeota archaeon]|nr:MAG: NusA-like transcription termination signal-binding factor [Candidatus Aenigmarchaeota archaeon]